MKLAIATVVAGVVLGDNSLLRTVRKGAKDLTESEMEALTTRYHCPRPKRPWQYWPLGCHHRHDDLKSDQEYANIEWQTTGNDICTYYKRCLRNCRGMKSSNNQCINPLTQVLTRGIKCNCKCSYACIERLNSLIDEHDGERDAINSAMLNDDAIVEVSDEHDELVRGLSEDTVDSDEGLILGVSEDDDDGDVQEFGTPQVLERSGQLTEDNMPTGRNVLASGPVDLSHFECGESVPNGLSDDAQERCHDYNWCHTEKFPCKYPCSRRCKQCLQQCPPCNCPKTGLADGRSCPDPKTVANQTITWQNRCNSNLN